MTPIAIPVRNPAGPMLLKRGNRLHLLAAVLIGANAYAYMHSPGASPVFFWCQVVIAVDIVLLVMADAQTLRESPAYGRFFRIAELVIFLIACMQSVMLRLWIPAILQAMLAVLYGHALYQEWWAVRDQRMVVQHLGVSIPGEHGEHFLPWNRIRDLRCHEGMVRLEDTSGEVWDIDLRELPAEEELETMEKFRAHYLG